MNITESLHRAVQQNPVATATIYGSRRQTFLELRERVACVAGMLKDLGLKIDGRVGMLALNSDRYLEYLLGTVWAGGAVNPVNIRWSAQEIIYSLEDCDTTILLVDDAFVDLARQVLDSSAVLQHLVYVGDGATPDGMHSYEKLLAAAVPVDDAQRGGNDLAGIFYTGGTSGFPKGVMLSHSNLCLNAMGLRASGCGPVGDRFLHAAPMFHIGSLTGVITQYMAGRTHVFVPSFSVIGVLNAIQAARVTDIFLVPTMIQMLIDCPDFVSYDVSSLRHVLYGSSPITEIVLERALCAFPGVSFAQSYGMTELSPIATLLGPEYHTAPGRLLGKLRSAGRALGIADVKIVDFNGQEVARGVTGEIAVRGPNVMLGYWKRPEESVAALRGGWMYTSDAGYMDDEGFVFVVDRLKDMIISGGENVYSAEVENAIAKYSAVAAVAVIGIPDQKWGEVVHATVVLKSGGDVTAEQIKDHCKTLIAGYKCPKSIEFVAFLPVTATGKIQKNKLRERFWQGEQRRVS